MALGLGDPDPVTATTRRILAAVPRPLHRLVPTTVRADLRRRTGLTVAGDLDHVPSAPAPARGEHVGPPDFGVLGAADAGGRWWLALIADHPEVSPVPATAEAASYFAPYATEHFGPDDVARFHAQFPRRPGHLRGFWSPDSLAHPWVPPLLAVAAPDVRCIVVLRDPVERLLAGLARTSGTRSDHPGSELADAVDRGMYAGQLRRLRCHLPRGQVFVVQYERCLRDPLGGPGRDLRLPGRGPGLPGPESGPAEGGRIPDGRADGSRDTRASAWDVRVGPGRPGRARAHPRPVPVVVRRAGAVTSVYGDAGPAGASGTRPSGR